MGGAALVRLSRAVRDRERNALPAHRRKTLRAGSAVANALHLQGQLRQGEPVFRPVVPRTRFARRAEGFVQGEVGGRRAGVDRRAHRGGNRRRRGSVRRAASAGVFVPADGFITGGGALGRTVNVKKGQFLAPGDMANVVNKIVGAGCPAVAADGARDDVRLQQSRGRHAVVADHACVRLSGDFRCHAQRAGARRRGRPQRRRRALRASAGTAVAAGCDGVFLKRVDPAAALSDGPNMIPLRDMRGVLETLCAIQKSLR